MSHSVTLTWTPSETDITEVASYTIMRNVNAGPYTLLAFCPISRDMFGRITAIANCTTTIVPSSADKQPFDDAPVTYVDGGLAEGSTYCYYVFATPMGNRQSTGQGPPSPPSNVMCVAVTPVSATTPVLSVNVLTQQARLTWTAATVLGSTIAHYELYRSTDGGATFNFLIEVGNVLAYADSPTPGASYKYYVVARPVVGLDSANSNIVTAVISNDPFADNVVLLMHFDGNVIDSSRYANQMILTGAGSIDAAIKKFGTGSFHTPDGGTGPHSGCRLFTPYVAGDPIDILSGLGDFTIEGWSYAVGSSSLQCVDFGCDQITFNGPGGQPSGIVLSVSGAGIPTNGSVAIATAINQNNDINQGLWGALSATGLTITANAWHHFAVVRFNQTAILYFDGNRLAVTGVPWINYAFFPTPHYVTIGTTAIVIGGNEPGYVDEVRITKGIARYTGTTYVVPTAPSFP